MTEYEAAKIAYASIINAITSIRKYDDSMRDFSIGMPNSIEVNGNTYSFLRVEYDDRD